MKSIGFIGGGRVTRIILEAFRNKKLMIDHVYVYDPNEDSLQRLKKEFPKIIVENNLSVSNIQSEVLFLAVHPPVMMETLAKIKDTLHKETLVVSLAPKITINTIIAALGGFNKVARVNPSATSIINQGINPVAFSDKMTTKEKDTLLDLLNLLGNAPIVQERKIEAYAIISAMGSTYFWFQLQHLKELAEKYGMDGKEANDVITDMLLGTAVSLFKSGKSPAEVMDLVPVKPITEYEDTIKSFYTSKLDGIFEKIKPA
jgi:pyrroline-5-carboxylate reductase